MNFLDFSENDELKARLSGAAERSGFSHAYIIWGTDANSCASLSRVLTAAMLCSGSHDKPCLQCKDCLKHLKGIHPDVINIEKLPDKREIYVAQIREFTAEAYVVPNEAAKKVYIIKDADSMNNAAQNALLKVLEDPPSYANFILLAGNPGLFLETIRSRCILLPVLSNNTDFDETEYSKSINSAFQAFCQKKRLELLAHMVKFEKLDRLQLKSFLDSLYGAFIVRLKTEIPAEHRERVFKACAVIESYSSALHFNVGSGHVIGALTAKLNSI